MSKHHIIRRTAALLVVLTALPAVSLFGQSRPPRISLWVTRSLIQPRQQGTYLSAYSPPMESGEYTSTASQTLSLRARDASGTSVGIALGIKPFLNLVFQIDWAETDLTGTNSPYRYSLDYVSTPPPNYTPTPVNFTRTFDWPDTEGKINHLSFSMNLQWRLRLVKQIMLDVSAGLTYFSLRGDASSLGFDYFWLGGHSVLFTSHYKLRMAFGPKGRMGGNAGVGLEIPLIRPIYLYFGGQLFLSPKIGLDPQIDFILNTNEILRDLSLRVIQQFMNLQPLELNPSRLQFLFGIRLRI